MYISDVVLKCNWIVTILKLNVICFCFIRKNTQQGLQSLVNKEWLTRTWGNKIKNTGTNYISETLLFGNFLTNQNFKRRRLQITSRYRIKQLMKCLSKERKTVRKHTAFLFKNKITFATDHMDNTLIKQPFQNVL